MYQKNKVVQKRYEGFLQTNSLWKNNAIYQLNQFKIEAKSKKIELIINENLRLGKYIERLVSYQLEQEESISIICENIQIQKEKITLGELDCILQKEKKIIRELNLYIASLKEGNDLRISFFNLGGNSRQILKVLMRNEILS